MKRCPACDQDKPLKAFYPKPRCPTCIACNRARRKKAAEQRRDDYKFARPNSAGARGVVRVKQKSGGIVWRAQVKTNGHHIHLGYHEDVLDAIVAASDFRIKHDLN